MVDLLPACAGNPQDITAQIRGTLLYGDPEPSPQKREGVETRRAASNADQGYDEGIVQTTNTVSVAVKAVVV